jgi:transcriptional regulator with XRE-family HTH domain
MSQLDLALQAGTTPRHVSFIETGRSRPGRDLVLRLAAAMDVPLRERNTMLIAAGLSAAFPARELSEIAMRPVRLVLDRVLQGHEPYPAWVIGRGMNFLASNCGAEALFPGMCRMRPEEIVDLWFGPGPFRANVENWPDVVRAGVASLRREASRTSDPTVFALLRQAEAHLREVDDGSDNPEADMPTICPRLNFDGHTIRTVSTVMRFDTAADVTASELRVELLFPADDRSDACLRELIASLSPSTRGTGPTLDTRYSR